MKAGVRILSLALITIAVAAGCGRPADSGEQRQAAPAEQSNAAPDALKFTATTVDGQRFSGESLAGKPAVLWFWASWCPVCQGESAGVEKVAQANSTVTFVGVAALSDAPAMREFVTRYGIGSFTNLADTDASVWQRFGVTSQPAYAFVRPNGTVETVKSGLSEDELAARVHQLAGT
ncbi:thiol-disulfide isomerase/thioredoxin [Amycolatopsis echigonensis]|uniref:Soluble secreted antigen MPT53 n=2 Tax=Pseudonocardiaceae TaxID=2070 RepID=A0A2N3WJL8_9PSEU|nr:MULTISPECIES: protein disulfide oxidoreductase [Pseudonocardiaceae]AEA23544.1 Redoxin domain protein [Pseudonocardia dioxanivorans CB1190]PKV94058.1 thiol-disulfide isomerase/thioredoxin [Amycolatopsis niigatensis]